MAEPTTDQRTPADPKGDVDFVLDPTGTPSTLRVSAKVLSVTSPVFEAMFKPEFNKGLVPSTSEPFVISFPEDAPEAMTWLCHALHLHPDLDHDPEFAIREQVAYLAHKYQCTRAIVPWSRVWLQQWRDAPEEGKNHLTMICMAYALNDEVQFWRSCQDFMRSGLEEHFPCDEEMIDPQHLGLAILPLGFVFDLRVRREGAISQTISLLENGPIPCIGMTDQEASRQGRFCNLGAPPHICTREAYVAHYFTELAQVGLWPLSRLHSLSLEQIYNSLQKYEKFEDSWRYPLRKDPPEDCRCGFAYLDDAIVSATQKANQELVVGYCLEHIKQGKFSARDNCRCYMEDGQLFHVRH